MVDDLTPEDDDDLESPTLSEPDDDNVIEDGEPTFEAEESPLNDEVPEPEPDSV